MQHVYWGFIGCGDVTEVKSGPAFSKISDATVVACMCRNGAMAKDYARRHGIALWYEDVKDLLANPTINAVYIATPPSTHCSLTLAALDAGKAVYVEKPMAVNAQEALQMAEYAAQKNIPLSVAHYRRMQPKFLKIKALLNAAVIGKIQSVTLRYYRTLQTAEQLLVPKHKWRIDPAIAGGGLFHDIAPHQLDLLLFYFGAAKSVTGIQRNTQSLYDAADYVSANMLFENDIPFDGIWSFNAQPPEVTDNICIKGEKGEINFSAFEDQLVKVETAGGVETFEFDYMPHVQQPMIAAVTAHFLGREHNPCTATEGYTVMQWMDGITY